MWRSLRYLALILLSAGAIVVPTILLFPPDLVARSTEYYAALTPAQVTPFDAQLYAAADNQPLFKRHPEYAEEVAIRAYIKGAIGFAEGTVNNAKGIYPYDVIVGYVDRAEIGVDYSDHYRYYNASADSDAAGLGQFMSFTWDGLVERYPDIEFKNLPRFHPRNQDIRLLLLLWETGSYEQLIRGINVDDLGRIHVDVDRFSNAVFQSCNIWASFPCRDGSGAHVGVGANTAAGVKSIESIWQNFQKALEQEQTTFLPVAPGSGIEEQPIVPTQAFSPEDRFPDDLKLPAQDGEAIAAKDGTTYPITDVRRFRDMNPVTGAAGYNRWHDGYDLATPVGVPLYLPMPGKAECHLGDNSGFGNYAEFFPAALDGRSFVFKHLDTCETVVWDGDLSVVPKFGTTGNTGFSSGPHLHLAGWRYVDRRWEHFDFAKGWLTAFLTGQLPE